MALGREEFYILILIFALSYPLFLPSCDFNLISSLIQFSLWLLNLHLSSFIDSPSCPSLFLTVITVISLKSIFIVIAFYLTIVITLFPLSSLFLFLPLLLWLSFSPFITWSGRLPSHSFYCGNNSNWTRFQLYPVEANLSYSILLSAASSSS